VAADHDRDRRRLVTGGGRYLDDLGVPGALAMAVVRSPVASARLRGVSVAHALEIEGVRAVITAPELLEHCDPFPGIVRDAPPYHALAVDRVRYEGEPVAVVVADDRYLAEDGARAVALDLEPLDAVVDPRVAAADSANVPWRRRYRYGDVATAFERASRVVSIDVTFPKYNSTPLETYGLVADWSAATGDVTVHSNFQGPFSLQPVMCAALRLASHQLRLVVAQDIGGSFGIKAMIYPYIVLAAVASKVAGAPVRWVEDRAEHLAGSASGTRRLTHAEAAVDDDGRVRAVRFQLLEDVGAYLRAPEPSCVMRSLSGFAGPYDIAHGEVDASVVLTNTLPTGLNRGYGGQQHIFTLERLMDRVACELGLDPAELRRRNLIAADRFPLEAASGTRYDSGEYHAALERALELAGYSALRACRETDDGRAWVGVGVATALHSSAANMGYVTLALEPDIRDGERYRAKSGSREWATVRVDPGGKVAVEIATAGAGQGHRETAARLVAEHLGIPATDVRAIDAVDTERSPWSVSTGSYSSRFAVMAANAIVLAVDALKDELLDLAAARLGRPRAELQWSSGAARHDDGAKAGLRELAGAAHWDAGTLGSATPALAVTRAFVADDTGPPDDRDRVNAALAYGFMADVAVVEVDKQTFIPRLRSYVAVHDVGRTLDAGIVAGQMYGGIVHGMAGALLETISYAPDGRLLVRDLMDYRCPEAGDAPAMTLDHVNAPSPSNPLGVKGAGESSSMSAPAAIAAAVEDALAHVGAHIDALPIDPASLWARYGRAA
jgi:2-furoyl-CoA dehydrogenase large subunit